MATSSPCYNHDDRSAVWSCMDCKPDCVIKFCKECHEHVHSIPIFKFHRTQIITQENFKRRLSQDISDLENLVVVEKDILKGVLTTLRYTELQEREMLQEVIKKTEQRLHNIQQCHEKVDKALMYLAKVATVISSCSSSDPVPAETLPNELAAGQDNQSGSTTTEMPHFPVDVIGSLNKNGCFWMVKKSTTERLRLAQIERDLRDQFKTNPDMITPPTLKEGMVYLAKSAGNTEFWRVRVEKLSNKMVKVRYLDYGMHEELPIHSIVDLPPIFKSIPYHAMECCLFPLTAQISLPYEAKWCFKDLTHGKILSASICSKMIYPHGHTLYHVQLTSAGTPPVNINQKVADLHEQKEKDSEDRPILPKDKTVVQENKDSKEIEKNKVELKEKNQVEENGVKVLQPSTESSPTSVVSQEPSVQTQEETQKKITILTRNGDACKESTPKDATSDPATVTIPEYVPIGYVNEHMYCSIYNECNTNKPVLRTLVPRARYFVTKGNDRQFVEAMKTKVWCCLDEGLACALNNAYKEQAAKQNAVLLVFVLPNIFAGLVRIVSEMNRSLPHCTIVSPGLLWGHACRAEFNIQLLSVDKFSFHLLENDSYLRIFLKDNVLGREIRFQKGDEICHRYERLRRPFSVLDNASIRPFQKDHIPRDVRSCQENLSEDEEPLSWRRRDDSKTTTIPKATEVPKTTNDSKKTESSKLTQNSMANEDWESDLDALPARVAEIYSTISSPAVSQGSDGDAEKLEGNDNIELDDETSTANTTNEESEKLEEAVVQNAEASMQHNAEGDEDGEGEEKTEVIVVQKQPVESNSQYPSDQTEFTNGKSSTAETTQAEANPQAELESNPEKNQILSQNDELSENTDEKDDAHKDTRQESPHPHEQTSVNERKNSQELLHQENDSGVEVIHAETATNENSSIGALPPSTEGKDQFPSDKTLDETQNKGSCSKDLPENNQELTGQTVHGRVENLQNSNQNFYHILSPPHTPITTTIDNELLKVDEEVEKMDENEKIDDKEEDASTATDISESTSCSSISDRTKEVRTSSFISSVQQQVHEDDQGTDDIDEEEAFLPVQAGRHYTVQLKVPENINQTVWARIYRRQVEEHEFCCFLKDLNEWGQTSDELSHVHLLRYCCVKNSKGKYSRTLITKVHRDERVTVRYIDEGFTTILPVNELREIDEQFVISMPPQAFECRFLNNSFVKEKFKDFRKRRALIDINVIAIVGEVAEVELIGIQKAPQYPKQRQ